MTHRRDEQVEIVVAVDVGERRPTGKLGGASRASGRSGVLELPVAEVAVHHVTTVESAEVNVTVPVVIVVAHGYAGTVEQVFVGDQDDGGEGVGKLHPGLRRVHQREPWLAAAGIGEVGPATHSTRLPIQCQAVGQG